MTGGFTSNLGNYEYYDPNTNAYDVIDLENIGRIPNRGYAQYRHAASNFDSLNSGPVSMIGADEDFN